MTSRKEWNSRDGAHYRLVLDSAVTDQDAVSLWRVNDAVFGDHAEFEAWRTSVWERHSPRDGFRLARAYDGEELVGFAYGHTEQGQWWTDRASELGPDVAAAWLGGHFDLVSIGVLNDARGVGIGRALIQLVTEDLPHERWLLMTTADESDPARQLYNTEGWHVIGPGVTDHQVIMAKGRPRSAPA